MKFKADNLHFLPSVKPVHLTVTNSTGMITLTAQSMMLHSYGTIWWNDMHFLYSLYFQERLSLCLLLFNIDWGCQLQSSWRYVCIEDMCKHDHEMQCHDIYILIPKVKLFFYVFSSIRESRCRDGWEDSIDINSGQKLVC